MGFLSEEMTKKEFLDRLAENNWNRPGDRAFFRKFYDYMKGFGDREDPLEVDTMWAPYTLFDLEGDKPNARESFEGLIREMISNPVYDVPEDLKESFENNLIDGNPGLDEPDEEDEIDGPENENENDGPEDDNENDGPEEDEAGPEEGNDAPEENAGDAQVEENDAPQRDDVDKLLILLADKESPSGQLLQYTDEIIEQEKEVNAERIRALNEADRQREAAREANILHDQEGDLREHIEGQRADRIRMDVRRGEKSEFTQKVSLKEFVTKARENGWTSMDDLSVFVALYRYADIVNDPVLDRLFEQITSQDAGLNELSRMDFIDNSVKPVLVHLEHAGLMSYNLGDRLEKDLTYKDQADIDLSYRNQFGVDRPQSSYEKRLVDAQTAAKKNPDDKIIADYDRAGFIQRMEENGWSQDAGILFGDLFEYKRRGLWNGDPAVDSFLTELANTSAWGPYNRDRLMKQVPEVISVLEGKNTEDRQILGQDYLNGLKSQLNETERSYFAAGYNLEEGLDQRHREIYGVPYQKTEDDIRFEAEQQAAMDQRIAEDGAYNQRAREEVEAQQRAEEERAAQQRAEEERAAQQRARESESFSRAREAMALDEGRDRPEGPENKEGRAIAERLLKEEEARQRAARDAAAEEERLYGYMTEKQKTYIKSRKKQIQAANEGFKQYIDVYGPSGKAPQLGNADKTEYDSIVIDIDEMLSEVQFANEAEKKAYTEKIQKELDPTTISAIVLGTCMADGRLEGDITDSTTNGNFLGANQARLTDDVMKNDERATRFIPIMTDGRKKAKEAIRDYIVNKNDAGIQKGLQTLADYTASEAVNLKAGTIGNRNNWSDAQKTGIMLGHDVIEKKPFGVRVNPKKEIGIITAESQKKQMRAMMESDIIKTALVDNFDQLSKEQKETMVGDMLFNAYLSQMSRVQGEYEKSELCRNAQTSKLVDKILEKHGLDKDAIVDPDREETLLGMQPTKDLVSIYIPEHLSKTRVSDFDVILAGKNGEQQLKSLYMDSIKKSEIFKNIVASESKGALIDQIMKADSIVDKGLTSIEGVKLPNAKQGVLERSQAAYDRGMKTFEEEIVKHALSYEVLTKDTAAKYGFTSLSPNAVKKNAENIKALYDKIDGNNTWGGSENYKNLLNKLKSLKQLSEKHAKHGMVLGEREAKEYSDLVQEVDQLADIYLENKKDIDSDYAERRVEGVKELRLALKANLIPLGKAVETMKSDAIKEVFGEVNKTYNETDPWHCENNAFYGQKYADKKMRPDRAGSYTLGRAGGISVTLLALAATGKYTLDELMDNSKLREEKAAMFDKVATHMKNAAPGNEHNKWLAEQIYKGQIATEKLIDDAARTVDFSDPNIRQNKTFCQLLHLTFHQFDAWQEMSHCKDEILELARKDHPEMNRWEDYKNWWTERDTPFMDINDAMSKQQKQAVEMMTRKDGLEEHANMLVLQSGFIDRTLKTLAQAQKSDAKDKPFRDWISPEQKMEIGAIPTGLGQTALQGKFKFLDKDPKLCQLVTKGLADGTLLKNMEMSLDMAKGKVKVTGYPTKEDMKEYVENQKFLKKTDMALKRLETGKYKSVDDFLKDSAYAIFGQAHRMSGGVTPTDIKTGKKLTLEEYASKAIKSKQFTELLRSKKDANKFMSAKSVAKMAQDKEIMKKIIKEKQKELSRIVPAQSAPVQEPKAQKTVGKAPKF